MELEFLQQEQKLNERILQNLMEKLQQERELLEEANKKKEEMLQKEKDIMCKRYELLKSKSISGGSSKHSVDTFNKVASWLKPKAAIHVDFNKENELLNIDKNTEWKPRAINANTRNVKSSEALPIINNSKVNTGAIPKQNFNQNFTVNYEKFNQPFQQINNVNINEQREAHYSPLSLQQCNSRMVMPKELPFFNGNPLEWPMFINEFEMTTEVCGYTNIENLSRLRKALKGDALEAVKCRLLLPENVPRIIHTLRILYGNPEIIIDTWLNKIRAEPAPKYEKLDSITKFALSVENLCATMEAAKLVDHLRNPLLLRELVDKLPITLRVEWARQAICQGDIIEFSEWLRDISENIRKITRYVPATDKKIDIKKKDNNYVNAHAEDVKNSATKEKRCSICQQSCKSVRECTKFKELSLKEKWSAVNEFKLCRTCLYPHQNKCKSDKLCETDGCTRRHHPLLHKTKTETAVPDNVQQNNVTIAQYSCTTHQKKGSTVLFRIVPVILYGENTKVETFAFIDEGSSVTLMDQKLADELKLSGPTISLCLKWTANNHRMENESKRVTFQISGNKQNAEKYKISNARTVKELNLPRQTLNAHLLARKYDYLKGLPIDSYNKAAPRLLIGLDNSKLNTVLKIRESGNDNPIAIKTRLGWHLYGTVSDEEKHGNIEFNSFHVCECERSTDEIIQKMVKEYINSDQEVSKSKKCLLSKEDERCLSIMESTTIKINNRYETGLLWKYNEFEMPDSWTMAKSRFLGFEKKMIQQDDLASKLKQKIREYTENNYIRKLTSEELKLNYPHVWYLPIFTVQNPNKPEKLRMVWDAAAKVNGISLNTMLLKGPDQLASLRGILLKFRENKIGICGDIREMFHQVRIKKNDQHSQRFLWRDKPSDEIEIYVMEVMTFGATCSPASAQYVKNKNVQNYIKEYPDAVNAIINNHYVDDLLVSVDTEDEAVQLANDIKLIHRNGGFEIRNWVSNSRRFLCAMGENVDSDIKDLNIDKEIQEKVLGMWWNTHTDTFTYSLKFQSVTEIMKEDYRPTKREVLRILMKIYDPLGLIANFLVYLKILLQGIWKSSLDWDDEINDTQYKKWKTWIQVLPLVETVNVPRNYGSSMLMNKETIQLHTFVDASEEAYAAVAYLRFDTGEEYKCALISAKTRVAPIKHLSIPRLELQAALLGARLANDIEINHSLKIHKKHFWSDSKTVISWLNSEQKKFRQFVAYRVGEILESTKVEQWHWISTKLNVADEATKWGKVPDFKPDSRWFVGPEFLRLPEEEWPSYIVEIIESDEEIKSQLRHDIESEIVENLVEPERFSNWKRLVRTVCYMHRFIHNINKQKSEKRIGSFTQDELVSGENYLYKQVQRDCFINEVIICKNNRFLPKENLLKIKKNSPIYNQSPYMDETGVLRVCGRIDAASHIDVNTKRPIILNKNHYITQLIIHSYHQKYHHINFETVVNEIRQKFSINKLRAAVKFENKNCQLCKNRRSLPKPPEMAGLPQARLASFTRPFLFVGVDYFGPLTVAIGRRIEKRWGVLLTCLTTRAIHIEIAHSLSTDSCILSLRNFIARRGIPIEIYSDNGTNFHGANNEIQAEMNKVDKLKLCEEFTTTVSKWIFIPPASPHMGGSWERLVQSVKKTLYNIMPSQNPSDELLKNMMAEVENIINSRPLTYIPIDDENSEAITPNHFLLGSSSGIKPLGECTSDREALRKNWKMSQQYANKFWKRWIHEYLPTLTRRSKWFQKVKPIEVGDIVIIMDENTTRNYWPKGKVLDVTKSKDGQVRSAMVQTSHGIYMRPAVKLAVLDVKMEGKPPEDPVDIPGGSVTANGE